MSDVALGGVWAVAYSYGPQCILHGSYLLTPFHFPISNNCCVLSYKRSTLSNMFTPIGRFGLIVGWFVDFGYVDEKIGRTFPGIPSYTIRGWWNIVVRSSEKKKKKKKRGQPRIWPVSGPSQVRAEVRSGLGLLYRSIA